MSNYAKLNITRSCSSSSAVIFIHNNLFNRWVEGREIPAQQTVVWTLEIGKVSDQMGCLNQRKILGKCPHTPPLMRHLFGPQWKLSGDVRLRVGGWAVSENLLLILLFHGVFFVRVSWCRLLVLSSMPLDEDVFTDYSVGQEIGKTNVMMLIIVVAGLKEMWRKIIFLEQKLTCHLPHSVISLYYYNFCSFIFKFCNTRKA